MRKLVGDTFEDDGKFWMSVHDFVYEYRALYVCRLFDPQIWIDFGVIRGAWKGEKAAGLPTKKNPNAKISKNPNYGICVTRKCEAFISLTIDETEDRLNGKFPIYFVVQKNGGKRVTKTSSDLLVGGLK